MSGNTADFRQGIFRTEGPVLSTDDFVRELDAIIDHPSRDRRNHPFVRPVEAGTATLDQIAGWRHQVTLWAHPANKLFGTMWSRCPDPDLADMIFENLSEEEHGTTSGKGGHIALNMRLLDALGWDEGKRAQDLPRMETWALRHWLEIVQTTLSPVEAIAAVSFTMERRNPAVLGRIYHGVKKHYKIPDNALESLAVHASHVEEEHGALGPIAFARYANTVYWQDRVRFIVQHTADMSYHMYNAWLHY